MVFRSDHFHFIIINSENAALHKYVIQNDIFGTISETIKCQVKVTLKFLGFAGHGGSQLSSQMQGRGR